MLSPIKSHKTIFICWILAILDIASDAYASPKEIIVSPSGSYTAQFKYENTLYKIRQDLDLKEKVLTVPDNCILVFEGGCIKNGTVMGNKTIVKAGKHLIFENIILLGSWDNREVFSEWLDFSEGEQIDNAQNFRNLMLLCTGDTQTDLYMQEGVFFCSVIKESSNIQVPSNTYWHNSAMICQLTTDLPKYSLILIKKASNVTIDGGIFVGDVQTHTGVGGEWGHGIKVAGGTNIVLKNLIAKEFWGDGIDLIEAEYNSILGGGVGLCNNVTIDNVKCLYNRRQGLSIEAAHNVVVKNSEFAYTGKYKMTSPGAGVDIEPWCKNETKIRGIKFFKCYIHNNHPQRDFCLEPTIQYHVKKGEDNRIPESDVELKECFLGKLYIFGAHTVLIVDCEIDEISHYIFGERIRMEGCTIKHKSNLKSRKGLTMRRCK